ncbi:MAG: response regulator [Bacillota bacterium]|jgi:two-component system response regulator YesN
MKILAVDDEPIMLGAIAKILAGDPTLQLETACNGREALEKTESFHPHLVIMDIKLPGVNGLETLAEIRRLLPNVVAIIISAYDNFIYAQEAIRLNVFDYLLKPINKTRLLEIIAKVSRRLEEQRQVRQAELDRWENYQKLRPLIERELIRTLRTGKQPQLCEEYQALLKLKIKAGFFMAVSLSERLIPLPGVGASCGPAPEKLDVIGDWFRDRFHCLIDPPDHRLLMVFVPLDGEEADGTDYSQLQQHIIQRVWKYLTIKQHLTAIRIGVSAVHHSPANFGLSYQEALQALQQQTGEGLSCYNKSDGQTINPAWEYNLEKALHEITEAVRFGQLYRVATSFQKLAVTYGDCTGCQQQLLAVHLVELLLTAHRYCRELAKEQTHCPTSEHLLIILDNRLCLADRLTLVTKTVTDLTRAIHTKREHRVKMLIIKAKALIDQLYHQELTLEKVARAIAISPFYLSRLFRKEMGVGFSEYLTRLRMEKSLTLLAQGLPVKECSFAVGYNDPNYFSRLFRKYFQLSPTAYRETFLPQKGGMPMTQPEIK